MRRMTNDEIARIKWQLLHKKYVNEITIDGDLKVDYDIDGDPKYDRNVDGDLVINGKVVTDD